MDLNTKLLVGPSGVRIGGGAEASITDLLAGSEGGGDDSKFLAGDGSLRTPPGTGMPAGAVRGGSHVVSAGEATTQTLAIATGAAAIVAVIVQILRGGADVTGDAAIGASGGTLTIANGASLYALTAGDVINWIAVGT